MRWAKVDFSRMALQLLPPLLRSPLLVALLKAMLAPVHYLYGLFAALKESTGRRLGITGNVISLEAALNEAVHLDGLIYIVSADDAERSYFYYAREGNTPQLLYRQAEGVVYTMGQEGEALQSPSFTVMVPTIVCTSLDSAEADVYGWQHLQEIRTILNTYKPAGVTYGITLYTYE